MTRNSKRNGTRHGAAPDREQKRWGEGGTTKREEERENPGKRIKGRTESGTVIGYGGGSQWMKNGRRRTLRPGKKHKSGTISPKGDHRR